MSLLSKLEKSSLRFLEILMLDSQLQCLKGVYICYMRKQTSWCMMVKEPKGQGLFFFHGAYVLIID